MRKWLLISLLLTACTRQENAQKQAAYINLYALADSLQQAWTNDRQGQYEKYARVDGEEERVPLKDHNFEAELAMIREFDINKYAAPGYYHVSLSPQPGAYVCAAADSTLQVKHMLVQHSPEGRLLKVEAYRSKSTFFYQRNSSFRLWPDSLLELHFWQKVNLPWSTPHEYLFRISRSRK